MKILAKVIHTSGYIEIVFSIDKLNVIEELNKKDLVKCKNVNTNSSKHWLEVICENNNVLDLLRGEK